MNNLFKVERQITNGTWYETMLSPFKTEQEAFNYIEKYRHYYPREEQNYRITNQIDDRILSSTVVLSCC